MGNKLKEDILYDDFTSKEPMDEESIDDFFYENLFQKIKISTRMRFLFHIFFLNIYTE